MTLAGRVAIILGICAVRDDEQLYILEQSAARPETLALVAVDLIESLLDIDAAALQFDMHQRKTVYQYSNIIAVRVRSVIGLVLVDDLERIIMNVALIEQVDILDRSVIARQQLYMILLNDGGLLYNSAVLVGNTARKKARPLPVGKGIVVQFFQLPAQVGDQLCLGTDRQIVEGLFL